VECLSGGFATPKDGQRLLPVLSLSSVSQAPRVSTVIRLLQRTFFFAKEFATIANDMVMLAGNPSSKREVDISLCRPEAKRKR
jgi:hypothetical protein